MDVEQKVAYEWALNQQYQSVAARYARTLAFYIKDLSAPITPERVSEWLEEWAKIHWEPYAAGYLIRAMDTQALAAFLAEKIGGRS